MDGREGGTDGFLFLRRIRSILWIGNRDGWRADCHGRNHTWDGRLRRPPHAGRGGNPAAATGWRDGRVYSSVGGTDEACMAASRLFVPSLDGLGRQIYKLRQDYVNFANPYLNSVNLAKKKKSEHRSECEKIDCTFVKFRPHVK